MTFDKLIVKGFDLHGLFFSYMSPLPIIANKRTRRLLLNVSPSRKLLPWGLMMLLLFFHGFGTSLYLIITELFNRRKYVKLLNFIIFILACTMYWVTFALNIITFYYAGDAVVGSNQLLDLEKKMTEQFPELSILSNRKLDIRGLVVLSEVFIASTCPLTFTVMAVYEDVDPTFFFLRDILPDVIYWNIITIISCLLLRLTIMFLGALEVARSLSLAVAFFIAGLEVYVKILRILSRINRRNFMVYYRQFRLVHYTMKPFVDTFMACGLSSSFIILVCLLWFTIRGYGRVHWFLYMGFVMMVSFLIIATLLCFPRVVELYECTKGLVRKWKPMSSTRWDFKRVGKRDGVAQAPLYFSCHWFFLFKRSSLRKFYSTVMEYWFTSVILVYF